MTLLNVMKNSQPATATAPQAEDSKQATQVRYVRPSYRIKEADTGFVAKVDMPGVKRDEVELSVTDGVLEISGTRKRESDENWKPLAGNIEDGVVYRLRLAIGDEVNGEAISAKLQDGVLNVDLPKAEEKRPRRIDVS